MWRKRSNLRRRVDFQWETASSQSVWIAVWHLLYICGNLRRETSFKLAVKCQAPSVLSNCSPCYRQSMWTVWCTPGSCKHYTLYTHTHRVI